MPRGFADHSVRRRTSSDRAVWAGAAFVVEALILLAFLAGCLAVFMQLFGDASETGRQNVRLERAVEAASNRAEQFAANPLAGDVTPGEGGAYVSRDDAGDGLVVECSIVPEPLEAGMLYRATIVVTDGGEAVYDLATARYVPASDGASAGSAPGANAGTAAAGGAPTGAAQGGGANG